MTSAASTPHPRFATELKPQVEIKVDLDDRAFLFPSGKSIGQLVLSSDGRQIWIDAVFPFNQARTPPRLMTLTREDAVELGRRLIDAVYYARTQLVITSSIKVTINVAANGYHFHFGDLKEASELFLSTACIWRVCQSLLRIADFIAPVESN
jgi:hypothetical protein